MLQSTDGDSNVGDSSSNRVGKVKGTLCGKGDMSIISVLPIGDEDGRGGVVIISTCVSAFLTHPMTVNLTMSLFRCK
jgi:hypothetical protein